MKLKQSRAGKNGVSLLITWVGGSPEEAETKDLVGCVCGLVGENENSVC